MNTATPTPNTHLIRGTERLSTYSFETSHGVWESQPEVMYQAYFFSTSEILQVNLH